MNVPQKSTRLIAKLPAIFQEGEFLGDFLFAFEKVLFGSPGQQEEEFPFDGLEKTIAGIATVFDPRETPQAFLSWLSDWTAFTLRADLVVTKQREFLANIIQLYRRRGTKENLKKLLGIFTVGIPTVTEITMSAMQIYVHSTVGVDTVISGAEPFFFKVSIRLPRASLEVQRKQVAVAHALIKLEKPAHTHYSLEALYPSMQIARYSTVGLDTLLGTETQE